MTHTKHVMVIFIVCNNSSVKIALINAEINDDKSLIINYYLPIDREKQLTIIKP